MAWTRSWPRIAGAWELGARGMWREPVRNDALSKEPSAMVATSAGGARSSSSGAGLAKRSGPPVAI